MNTPKRYLITSALPYANGELHLGHLAGAYLPADIYVRYLRLLGKDVVWVCGSDEHGAAITMRAKKEGISPKEIIDKYHELNKETFQRLGISFDYYHRTSEELHHETSQDFFLRLHEKGDEFEVRSTQQYYDREYDQFLADRYIKGTCPRCGHPDAYGDQCENCGSDLSPTELIDPVSTLSGNTPELRETKHWYFKLDKHEEWLREWIATGQLDGEQHHDPNQWKKHVVGQCLSWLDNGLQPRSITRDLDWGISVPLEGAEGKVLYVWFDAPIGYISSTKQWALENDRDWEIYWRDEDTALIHFIGKDNIVFHCIVFPAMLHAYGGYVLPRNVPANQFLNFEGQKFSKSRGWGIEQHAYLEEFADFPNKEDALRYALLRILPENRDSDFKWDEFVEYHDKELADKLGNFLNRVIVLTNKYYDGAVPEIGVDLRKALAEVITLTDNLTAGGWMPSVSNRPDLFLIELSTYGNTYLQDVSPWKIWKEDPDSDVVKECILVSLQIAALISILCEPFIPFTSPRVREQLNLPPVKNGELQDVLDKLRSGKSLFPEGHKVGDADVLFPKINDRKDTSRLEIVNRQKDKLEAILAADRPPEREPVKPEIQYDDFAKLDLRTATITAAENVPKADKLLKLSLDMASEQRTVVSGIAEHYKPEEIIGRQVVVVANLAPRKLRGILSQGMILMAENAEGKLVFVSPESGFGNGWTVR
ncbi:MAG: methionine--tRNA ligase [Saprospiraceae bacterium]